MRGDGARDGGGGGGGIRRGDADARAHPPRGAENEEHGARRARARVRVRPRALRLSVRRPPRPASARVFGILGAPLDGVQRGGGGGRRRRARLAQPRHRARVAAAARLCSARRAASAARATSSTPRRERARRAQTRTRRRRPASPRRRRPRARRRRRRRRARRARSASSSFADPKPEAARAGARGWRARRPRVQRGAERERLHGGGLRPRAPLDTRARDERLDVVQRPRDAHAPAPHDDRGVAAAGVRRDEAQRRVPRAPRRGVRGRQRRPRRHGGGGGRVGAARRAEHRRRGRGEHAPAPLGGARTRPPQRGERVAECGGVRSAPRGDFVGQIGGDVDGARAARRVSLRVAPEQGERRARAERRVARVPRGERVCGVVQAERRRRFLLTKNAVGRRRRRPPGGEVVERPARDDAPAESDNKAPSHRETAATAPGTSTDA